VRIPNNRSLLHLLSDSTKSRRGTEKESPKASPKNSQNGAKKGRKRKKSQRTKSSAAANRRRSSISKAASSPNARRRRTSQSTSQSSPSTRRTSRGSTNREPQPSRSSSRVEPLYHQQTQPRSPGSPETGRTYNPWAPHPSSRQRPATPENTTHSQTPSRTNTGGSPQRSSRQSANAGTSKKRSGSTAKSQKPKPQTNRRRTRKPRKKRKPSPLSPLLYVVRLTIAGVGLSAIAGTFISVWHPTVDPQLNQQNLAEAQENRQLSGMATPGNWNGSLETSYPELSLKYELDSLKSQWKEIVSNYSRFDVGAFLLDLDTGAYINLNSKASYSAASTIKVPILIAFMQEVDAGNIQLQEKLEMKEKHVAGGSGNLQYQQVGTQYTAWELASKTIAISDNTATNILIDRLGGIEKLNQRFQSWGLQTTRLRNPLPDLEGTNTTNPQELAKLMAWIEQGHMLTLRSRDRLLHLMRQTENDSLLPQGLPSQASIAHKTGDIGSLLADVGTIDLPNGKRYLLAVMVKRPHNNYVAADIIRKISQTTAKSLNSPEAMSHTKSDIAKPQT